MKKPVCHPVEEWIKRITYKPNFKLHCESNFNGAIQLNIVFKTPNSYNPKELVDINFSQTIDQRMISGFDYFVYWVREQIIRAEDHEMREYFKVDGKMVNDPHANDYPRFR